MRGDGRQQRAMYSYISPEARVPQDHPLRVIRVLVDEVLRELSPLFEGLYARVGRPSIPPEKLLRAQLLQVLHTVRAEGLPVHGHRRPYRELNQRSSVNFFARACRALLFPVRKLQCDNGTEFSLSFVLTVQEAGVKLRYIRPRQPQQNGKVERSHRIDAEEFWRREAPPDLMAAVPTLQAWERRYNFERFSVAPKGEIPAENLQRLLSDAKAASTISGRAIPQHPLEAAIYEPHAPPTALRSLPGLRSATAGRSPWPIQNELEKPRIVEQILTHLGLPSEPVRADPAQPPPASAADLFAETPA